MNRPEDRNPMSNSDKPPTETKKPSEQSTPAGDVPSLEELAEEQGGTTDPDEVEERAQPD